MLRDRPYASYFHFRGDQAGTERDVVTDWVHARLGPDQPCFVRLEHRSRDDPPDVVLIDRCGRRHGFEVTEFVDGPTITSYAKGRPTGLKSYTEAEFRRLVEARIREKASRNFRGEPCVTKRLLIYSDESLIRSGDGIDFLLRFPVVNQSFFDEVWFMLPPLVTTGNVPEGKSSCRLYEIKSG